MFWNASLIVIGCLTSILSAIVYKVIGEPSIWYYLVGGLGGGILVASPDSALLLEASFGLDGDDFESLSVKFEVCSNIFSTMFYLLFCSSSLISGSNHFAYQTALCTGLITLTAPYTFVMVNYALDESYIYVKTNSTSSNVSDSSYSSTFIDGSEWSELVEDN